jgi:hypothetical protein
MIKYYSQILQSNITVKYYSQILQSNITVKYYSQIVITYMRNILIFKEVDDKRESIVCMICLISIVCLICMVIYTNK